MKIVKFLLSLLLTGGLIYALSIPITIGDENGTTLPPSGPFFSPFTGFWQNAEPVQAHLFKDIEVPNRKGRVTVHFDERMVPHIFAENMEDALFAQGYIEAALRLWQMDMITRVASGRLAEIMGKNLLNTDKLMRRRGMLYGAMNSEKAWKQSPETVRLLGAYQQGINTWIDQLDPKDYPIEFKLLNYRPERWNILKTALVRQYMNLTLNFRQTDVEATNALGVFGEKTFRKLFPEKNPKQQPIIPKGTPWAFEPVRIPDEPVLPEAVGLIPNPLGETDNELVGSNNWAVAGWKTATGKPILCNDPHLQLSLPSIWFELQINIPQTNVYGVSIPGLPGVIIGFNENIAWGVTNVGHDVADWYKIEWANKEKTAYFLDGEVKNATLITESYRVKGLDQPVFDTVKWTTWGPVVYQSDHKDYKDLALRWLSHDAPNSNDFLAFLHLNLGKNFDDYRKAMREHVFPAQNFLFAGKNGDIAITVNGRFPLKRKGQGRFVQPGNSTRNAWAGFIPMDHVPTAKNPKRGFLGSANQRSTDDTYPYYYNAPGFDQYRGRLLFNALSQMDSIRVEDMMALQLFNYSLHAEEGLTALLNRVDTQQLTDRQRRLFQKMAQWDFSFDKDKVQPVIFQEWWRNYYHLVFDEIFAWQDSIPILKPGNWRLIDMTNTNPTDPIFDNQNTPQTETATEMATQSFQQTCTQLTDQLLNPTFDWAAHKKTSIMHMARIPAFSRMNLDVGGYRHALNAISETHGPSWRMVVQLGDEVKAWGVFPGGQSGNPGSKFYDLDVDTWRTGSYNPLFFMKDAHDSRQPILYSMEINRSE